MISFGTTARVERPTEEVFAPAPAMARFINRVGLYRHGAVADDRGDRAAGVLTPASAIGSVLGERLRPGGAHRKAERLAAGAAAASP
jgi:hypothetical protein